MVRQATLAFAFAMVALAPACVPDCFDEAYYLKSNPDVAAAIADGRVASGRAHYEANGRVEGRPGCITQGTSTQGLRDPRFAARIGIFALLGAGLLFWSARRGWGAVPTSLALAACMAGFAWFDYLTGKRVFIFMDIASDTAVQFWPMMTFFSRQIWSGHLPMWSFEVGLGQNMFPGWLTDPFTLVAILSGESRLPYALAPMHVLKVLAVTACMAGYFKLRGYSRTACIVGALSVAFCGHLVARGTWYEYATEVAFAAFYLYALERFLQSGRFVPVALATFFIGCFGTYYAYLYFFLLTTFVLVRVFYFGDRLFAKPSAVFWRWAGASALGVMMVAMFLLPDILATLRSPWVAGEKELMSGHLKASFFEVEKAKVLVTAIARQLSPNLLGTANRYSGSGNYLEAPLAYAGVLAVLGVIPCFVHGDRKLRRVLGAFVALAVAYHLFVYFRIAVDAFVGPLFKISNLWISVGLALCAARAVDFMERRKTPVPALGASLALAFAMLAAVDLFAPGYEMTVDRVILWSCAAAALACAGCLAFISEGRASGLALGCLVAVVAGDLTLSAYQSANVFRGALDGAAPKASYAPYDDAANKVIRRIRGGDRSPFRIERDKNSVFMMDALMQDYFGTKAYMSSYASPSYVQVLWSLGVLNKDLKAASYIDGIGPRSAILPLLGVKYYLSTKGEAPPGWTKQFEEGGIRVFSTGEASLGFYYRQAVSRAAFEKLPPVEKQAALLHAAVLDAPSGVVATLPEQALRAEATAGLACTDKETCISPAHIHDDLSSLARVPVRFTSFEEDEVRGSISAPEPGVLFLSIPWDSGWRLSVDGRDHALQRVNIGFLGVELPAGDHEFVLTYRTPGFLPGLFLSITALLALAGWAFAEALRRSGKSLSPSPRVGDARLTG